MPYTSVALFRQLGTPWDRELSDYLAGRDDQLLQSLAMALIESPRARINAGDVQEKLWSLSEFYATEVMPLRRAQLSVDGTQRFLPQRERDPFWIKYRQLEEIRKSCL